jgi:phosphoenolpyruvate carboxykinase (GTP)
LWPGYGDNARVLKWIVERIRGTGAATETPIGYVPSPGALDTSGLDIAPARLDAALRCDRDEWIEALDELGSFYEQFGPRLPQPVWQAHADTRRRFGA